MDEHNEPPASEPMKGEYDRRRGPRRSSNGEPPEGDRRAGDRRKVPGLTALIDAILGVRRVKPPEDPKGDEAGS